MIKKLFFFSFLFITCINSKGINITVKNNQPNPIHNVEIYTSEQTNILRFDQINEDEEVVGFLSMSNAKSDGQYIIQFETSPTINGETKRKKEKIQSGYYTNGSPIDKNHVIWINKDTTKWQSRINTY